MATQKSSGGTFKLKDDGLWFSDTSGNLTFVCPFIVKSADLTSRKGWQTALEFDDQTGNRRIVTPPRSAIKKIQTIRDLLMDHGFEWPDIKSEEEELLKLYLRQKPKRHIALVEKTGWHKRSTFVFQDGAIGAEAGNVRFKSYSDYPNAEAPSGSLVKWRIAISKIIPYTSTGMLAMGTALGAPFHTLLNIEGGGFNLFGAPGKGKTSTAAAAESVFAKSGRDNVLSWDVSESRLDELRSERCDMLIYLDDMGRAGKSDTRRIERISDAAFRLTTGAARARSKHFKVDPALPASRVAILSSSVRSMLDISLAVGSHVFGGEEVRLIDVPAVVSEKYGVFEQCPPTFRNTREAVFELESIAADNYGVAGRAYIERIVSDFDNAVELARKWVAKFVDSTGATATSETRYVSRFGLAYAGLKLASKYGIIDLPENAAWKAIRLCYKRARESAPTFPQTVERGFSKLKKNLLALAEVVDLTSQGSSISPAAFGKCYGVLLKHSELGAIYAVKFDKLGQLSDPALSSRQIVDCLKERGLLVHIKGGKSTIPLTIPGLGAKNRQRMVCILRRKLTDIRSRSE